jgi:hypothetical protein
MSAGMINDIALLTSKEAVTKPHYTLIIIVVIMFAMIFMQRMFNMYTYKYSVITTCFMIFVISLFIISTILDNLNIKDTGGHIERFNKIFNSAGSRNFLIVISLLMYVIFIYETPTYDSNLPHHLLDKALLGHNAYISNRMVGIWLIVFFGLMTAYTVYVTTREED